MPPHELEVRFANVQEKRSEEQKWDRDPVENSGDEQPDGRRAQSTLSRGHYRVVCDGGWLRGRARRPGFDRLRFRRDAPDDQDQNEQAGRS